MAYQYKFTPLAYSDLDNALDYISEKLLNPNAANNLFHAVQREIRSICSNPYAFPDCSNYLIDSQTIRHAIVGNYILIFEVYDSEKTISILRFLYGRMDIPNMTVKLPE